MPTSNPKKTVQPPTPESQPKAGKPQGKSNVIELSSLRCKAEGCNKKHEKADFCAEHFQWFKEGLINKDGKQVPDFDKKMQAFRKVA